MRIIQNYPEMSNNFEKMSKDMEEVRKNISKIIKGRLSIYNIISIIRIIIIHKMWRI